MFYLLLLWSLLSVPIFICAVSEHRFCEVLPLGPLCSSLVLYVFGIFQQPRLGAALVLALQTVLGVWGLTAMIRKKCGRRFLEYFSSPAAAAFLLLFVILSLCSRGLLASHWDEFTHWMDSVKVITQMNVLASNPASHSAFMSYPPFMTLYEYFVQFLWSCSRAMAMPLEEGHVYLAYQLFSLSLLFPFFRDIQWKKIWGLLLIPLCCLLPVILYHDFYSSVYIDPFVGLLAGTAFAHILLDRDRDRLYRITLAVTVAGCVLSKDVGLFFALFVSVAFFLDAGIRSCSVRGKARVEALAAGSIPLIFSLCAKLSWSLSLTLSQAVRNFSQPVNFGAYLKMFFLHSGPESQQSIVNHFQQAFFENRLLIGNTSVRISYALAIGAALLALAAVYLICRRLPDFRKSAAVSVLILLVLQTVLYIFGQGMLYVYKFNAYEALALASYERYMNISCLVLLCVILLSVVQYLSIQENKTAALSLLVFCAAVVISPRVDLTHVLRREHVEKAREFRAPYEQISCEIGSVCERDSRIAVIAQEGEGLEFWALRYCARPFPVENITAEKGWSVGIPFYEGDFWTLEITPAAYLDAFRNQGFEYLEIFRPNSYFREEFGVLFEDPDAIAEGTLFHLDPRSGKFRLCSSDRS